MHSFKQLGLLSAITASLTLAGCGGSSSSGSSTDVTPETEGTEVGGTVSAPGGMVAQFEPVSPFQLAAEFFIPSAAASITGLEPVEGADVELIRVDNDGNQVGEVLARTTTSITGDYTLNVPAGTSLAGNLIVRITGSNNNQLRAQVVEQDVDIDPISEFILQKFIEQGANLETLETDKVVKLQGQAEQFDLTAEADLTNMLATLDSQLGDFVEGQVDLISTPEGDVTEIAGDFRSSALNLGLHDSDGQGYGTFAMDIYGDSFSFSDNGEGEVGVTLDVGYSAYANFVGADDGTPWVNYFPEPDVNESESFVATYTNNGVLTLEGEFEEEIDGDFGFRFPPVTYRLQKNTSNNLFFLLAQEAVVRYRTVDTNNDGQKDAIDPNQKDGDEILRSLEYFARLPENATASDLSGDFGLVSLLTYLGEGSGIRVESETSTVNFDGSGNFVVTGGSLFEIFRDATGNMTNLEGTAGDDSGSVTLEADGTISAIGGGAANGFVNDTFDFVAVPNFNGTNPDDGTDFAEFNHSLMVKLPNGTAPDLTDRTYRVFLLSVTFENDGSIYLNYTGFDSTLSFASNESASIDAKYSSVVKSGSLASEVGVENFPLENDLTVSLDGTGSLNLTAPQASGGDGVTSMDGFMSADGSLGLLRTSFDADGAGSGASFNELGLVVLVELP
ncbi:hypothetical protein KEHDKFFH_13995 [Marinobacter maroccanus]|uniref:TRAM domain-containing protein n=1 Tax=Marinobacter maroccanus TaxID=2055143 RepID=A0A2S5Z835_9GAMM|nr:hypothetical protein [Marinobacter maroccanus]PPI83478.1 hypothetical protein KEHDKFFH_13995 [Marinobacter maroccanus]